MREQLTLSSHPLRRQLRLTRADRVANRKRAEDSDVKLFLLSFSAFFVCFYTLIA
ncbi:hypothetical protein [Sphingomonas sp.]|uniref:hypothetical protein n=1 Tax=Sphingomonas sp. TaxID=28214 RepID=UPI002CFFEC58|nr:hypothetical protein [Sphingomonas sp.]HTG37296.1 hypothetical protein [Sphingomonas sp.]